MSNIIIVTARPAGGRRRCGVHHPATPVTHPPGRFTAEEVEQLKADRELVVVETTPGATASFVENLQARVTAETMRADAAESELAGARAKIADLERAAADAGKGEAEADDKARKAKK